MHKLRLSEKKLICDCQYDIYTGLPCQHLLCLVSKDPKFTVESLTFLSRWELSFFQDDEDDDFVFLQDIVEEVRDGEPAWQEADKPENELLNNVSTV